MSWPDDPYALEELRGQILFQAHVEFTELWFVRRNTVMLGKGGDPSGGGKAAMTLAAVGLLDLTPFYM